MILSLYLPGLHLNYEESHPFRAYVYLAFPRAAFCAARAWWGTAHPLLLKRVGGGLGLMVILQVMLGIGVWVGVVSSRNVGEPTALDLVLSTAHQTNGALLLGLSVLLMLWTVRLLKQETANP